MNSSPNMLISKRKCVPIWITILIVFRGKTILLPCDDPEWSNFTKYFAQNFELFGLKIDQHELRA